MSQNSRKSRTNRCHILLLAAILALFARVQPGEAVQVQDLVRVKGAEANKLVGMGIVIGLKGTGDGGKSATAMRSLAAAIQQLNDPMAVAAELKDAKNVALVTLSVNLPASGVREGDQVDVQVSAIAAKSLEGGRLFLCPMIGPNRKSPIFAYAEGALVVENKNFPTTAVIRRGAQLTRDIFVQYMDEKGRITLVLNDSVATLPIANNLANLINGFLSPDGPNIAKAIDQKNVVIDVPRHEQRDASPFISSVLQTFIDPQMINTGARVVINEKTGTIVFSHDVQFLPVAVMHGGLSINMVTPEPAPTVEAPRVDKMTAVPFDPANQGGAKLAELIRVFNQLKVEPADRIAIIKELHRSGKLFAQLILE